MPLRFENDAICLSGALGTKLKSKIIGKYYKIWWEITSGGRKSNFSYPTSIVEMNAATGEVFIEHTREFILGSAGHALELKFRNQNIKNPNLDVILVEEDEECIKYLKNNIQRKYPHAIINLKSSKFDKKSKDIVLIRKNIDQAIEAINQMNLSNRSLYFFDPLLSVHFDFIKKVYDNRIRTLYSQGIEFIIFFFTSDWVMGRGVLTSLPNTSNEEEWSANEKKTINELNKVFGDKNWQPIILKDISNERKIQLISNYYREKMHEMFRFVIPMPFSPKEKQVYHLFFCSNFTAGARIITSLYRKYTKNEWRPNNTKCYNYFKTKYQNKLIFPKGSGRPDEWKFLWFLIRNFIYGIFDEKCHDLYREVKIEKNFDDLLAWLIKEKFIKQIKSKSSIARFRLNWKVIKLKIGLDSPKKLIPLTEKDFKKDFS
ncbi:MAG: three-Cys-motif partner protein TcmP [Promethearchaeota archaeon]